MSSEWGLPTDAVSSFSRGGQVASGNHVQKLAAASAAANLRGDTYPLYAPMHWLWGLSPFMVVLDTQP